jgi:hypothetical protein
MPAQRPRASFEPIPPDFDLKSLVEATPNFSYVDRISCDMIEQQGMAAFEKLVLLHVIVGGKPLVIDGFEDRLDPWTFQPKWLKDNCGDKVEHACNMTSKEALTLTMGHYLKNMKLLTDQFFEKPGAYREKARQRVYLKDIDCPGVWWDKVKEHIPPALAYLNESTGDLGGAGSAQESNITGRKLGKGIARAGDLMSSLPTEMRAENLMCYIGHEGTYTPAHREMCASLGQNIMVEASGNINEDGTPEKPGSSIWFMTESKDRHLVSEYWLSVLGHDIEVENHFAQVVAWKKAPFGVYVVEQRPGDFILIPPLAPHQVWNRGTRTMKVAWNRTTVETLEMAMGEALPRSRIVCRDEQYKNKAIVYFTLQKYGNLLGSAQQQASRMPADAGHQLMYSGKIKALQKDFKRLFSMYRQILLSEMFNPEERDTPKNIEYVPFDSNVTCAYCRGNIFNRFLSCGSCKDMLGHLENGEDEGDPYDVCMDCYAMGRSCFCVSNLKWVEQFRWKELASKYDSWRQMIIMLDGGQITEKTPLTLIEERRRYGRKTLAEVCKDQLKRRPFKDKHKPEAPKSDAEDEDEEIVVGDDGMVKKISKKKSKTFLKNNTPCHVCCHRHPNWKMAFCTTCDRAWCYGSLFRGWDKMPIEIMEDPNFSCPHCLGICFAGACKREGKMQLYEPKGTLLGHDTKKVADARSVEALVDFSVSNLNWLKDDEAIHRSESSRIKRAKADAQKAKENDPTVDDDEDAHLEQSRVDYEYSPTNGNTLDPALGGTGQVADPDDDAYFATRLQHATSTLPPPADMVAGAPPNGIPDGYAPVSNAGYVPPLAQMYGDEKGYHYPDPMYAGGHDGNNENDENGVNIGEFGKRKRADEDDDFEDISMNKGKKAKKPRLAANGFRSLDLADSNSTPTAKSGLQKQFEKEKERKALEKAQKQGRFIMVQARLKNKKRIVKLSIPGHRLQELAAEQAAKAASMAQMALAAGGDDADADHEVDDATATSQTLQADVAQTGIDLLKSDIAPKKKINSAQQYEQRVAEGHLITSTSKKALIPVEKDDNYTAYRPERKNPGVKSAASSKGKRRGGRQQVQYEEVDIGSDAEDEDNDDGMFVTNGAAAGTSRRRTLPTYLQGRDADDDEDFPESLPDDYRDGRQPAGPKKRRRANSGAAAISLPAADPENDNITIAKATQSAIPQNGRPSAGKQPIMHPAPATDTNDADSANDMDVDEDASSDADSARPSPAAASTTKPNGARMKPFLLGGRSKPATPNAAAQKQAAMEEANRRAKLQALQMVSGDALPGASAAGKGKAMSVRFSGVGTGGENNVSMAEGLEDSDDEVDSAC